MKNDEKGMALIMALFTLLFVSLAVVMFVDTVTIEQTIATNHIKDIQAAYLADAGIEYAIIELKADASYDTDKDADGIVYPDDPDDYDSETLTVGSYKVGIPVGDSLPKTVVAAGMVGDFARSVEAVLSASGPEVVISTWRKL